MDSAVLLASAALGLSAVTTLWHSPLVARLKEKRRTNKLRKLPRHLRGIARFKERYPKFSYGEFSYGVPRVEDWRQGTTLSIGRYCSISAGVAILLGGNHRMDWMTTFPLPDRDRRLRHIDGCQATNGDVVIGNDVWLCSDAKILSGVTVGHGAVVAANALVTKDVPPYAIVGGQPAKVIGWRFPEAVREALLASEWWSWPHEEVISIGHLLCQDEPEKFLAYVRHRNALAAHPGPATVVDFECPSCARALAAESGFSEAASTCTHCGGAFIKVVRGSTVRPILYDEAA